MANNGQMKWRTCFSSVSDSGYKLDILKSALQKYLRRREEEKMLWCLSEIYMFQKYSKTEQEKRASKGIITNLINRLVIMMDEEMLFVEIDKYMKCMKWIKMFNEGNREKFELLVKVCKTMTGARLLRLNSDIYSYWWRGAGVYNVVKLENVTIEKENHEICIRFFDKKEKECETWEKERNAFIRFVNAFRNYDASCYYWALVLFHSKTKGKTRFRRKDCVYIIWEYLFQVIENDSRLKECLQLKLKQFFVKTRHEQHMWLSSAISIALNRKELYLQTKEVEEWDIKISDDEVENYFKNREKMEIDDYAIDMHCSQGRKMGKMKAEFALVGCVVVDEDREYFQKEWRDLYIDLKVNAKKYGTMDTNKRPKNVSFTN